MILFKKADNKKRTILENYTPSVDNPATLIADFYALDYMINGFRSYNSNDAMFGGLDPRGFSSDDPEYKEKYIEKGTPNVPPGYLGEDLKLIAKKRQETLEKVSYVLRTVLGYGILGEGKYINDPRVCEHTDEDISEYLRDGLGELDFYEPDLSDQPTAEDIVDGEWPYFRDSCNDLKATIYDLVFEEMENWGDYITKNEIENKDMSGDIYSMYMEEFADVITEEDFKKMYNDYLTGGDNYIQSNYEIDDIEVFTSILYNFRIYALNKEEERFQSQYDLFENNKKLNPDFIRFLGGNVDSIVNSVLEKVNFYEILGLGNHTPFLWNFVEDGELTKDVGGIIRDEIKTNAIKVYFTGNQIDTFLASFMQFVEYHYAPDYNEEEEVDYSNYKYSDVAFRYGYEYILESSEEVIEAADEALPYLKEGFGFSTADKEKNFREYKKEHGDDDPYNIFEYGDNEELQKLRLNNILSKVNWASGFGGEAWSNITDGYAMLMGDPYSLTAIDYAIDTVHNNGRVFDKVGFDTRYDSSFDLDNILDTKTFMGGKYHSRENRKDRGRSAERYKEGQPVTPTDLEVYLSEDLRQVYHDFSVYEESGGLSKPSDSVRQFMSEPDPTWYGKPKRSGLTFEEWKKKRGLLYRCHKILSMWGAGQ